MKRKGRRKGLTTFTAGLIGLIVIVVFTYLGFTKFANPFASQYTVDALFSNANGLRPASLVRIAGVNVGKVESISPVDNCQAAGPSPHQCSAADVKMTIDDQGLPLHQDATFAIRPRIFLEGNFFVDVRPGSPSAPVAATGHVFPIQQGTEPVQFDQVLTSLQSDTRRNLQILLEQYGTAVKQGGPSYNSSIQYWLPAYEYSSIVAHDALGIQPHDLSNWINQQGTVSGALDTHPQNLENLVTDFNTTANAFARQSVALQNAVAELPRTLAAAIPAFNSLNAAFPPLRAFARALIPGVQSTGPMIDASLPFITQLRLLVRPQELGGCPTPGAPLTQCGLTANLAPTIPALNKLTLATIPFMRGQVRPASSCVANVIYPWSQLTLNDPHFNASNGFPPRKAYVEAVDFLPGLAGESRNFDANGPYIRILGALGSTAVTSLQSGLIGGELAPIIGNEPALPPGGQHPPLAPTVPCETQPPITDLSAPSGGAPPTLTSTSPLPTGLIPLPPLPLGLSKDRSSQGGASGQSSTSSFTSSRASQSQSNAAARKKLEQTGLFEITTTPQSSSGAGAKSSKQR
jgi:phospholipid/cholesterol/gamma-HCH transport system substrate-binding protein